MAPHSQIRAIDLEYESRLVNGVVFLLHDVSQTGKVGLTARVVLIAQEMRDDSRRGRSHKSLGGLHPGQRCFEVRDILLHCRHILPGNRAIARRSRNSALASHTLTLCSLGKISPIGAHGYSALSPKPAKAMSDIGRVANLPLLTIIDDVHSSVCLLPHYLGDGTLDTGVEGGGIGGCPGVQRFQRGRQVWGARQAPRVSGENTFSAALHGGLLLCAPARRALVRVCWAAPCSRSPAPKQTPAALYVTALHTARQDDQELSVCYDARAARTGFGNKEISLSPWERGQGCLRLHRGRKHGSRRA